MLLDTNTAQIIENANDGDGIGAWKTLLDLFESKDTLRMTNILREFMEIKLSEDGDMEEFLMNINSMVREIRDGEGQNTLSDKLICWKLLTSLPPSYQQWSLTKGNDKDMTLNSIQKELRTVAKLHKQQENHEPTSFFTRPKPQPQPQQRKEEDTRLCTFCNMKGHTKSNCRTLKKVLELQQEGKIPAGTIQTEKVQTPRTNLGIHYSNPDTYDFSH